MADEPVELEDRSPAKGLDSLSQPGPWHYIIALPNWLAAATLFVLMLMTFADVMMRSILDNPIEIASELTRFFMAIIVFASLPMVSWRSQHIVVDLLDPLFGRTATRIRDILLDLLAGFLLLWPAMRVYELAERAKLFGDRTEYLEFPVFYIQYFIAFFTAVTALTFIARGITRIVAPSKVAF
jgi:TRAP-type C4-dicarboxylate transport system permease small subunit